MPEERVALRNCGVINPRRISTYLAVGGFQALAKVREMTPEGVIEEIKASGLSRAISICVPNIITSLIHSSRLLSRPGSGDSWGTVILRSARGLVPMSAVRSRR